MGMDALVELVTLQVIAQGPKAFCRQVDAAQGDDTVERLGQITVPTLVVAGEDDMIIRPNHDHRLHAGIRGAKYVRTRTAATAQRSSNRRL